MVVIAIASMSQECEVQSRALRRCCYLRLFIVGIMNTAATLQFREHKDLCDVMLTMSGCARS